jgi:hypothetical protein
MEEYFVSIRQKPIAGAEIVDLFGLNPHSNHHASFAVIKSKADFKPVLNLKLESECSPCFKQAEVIGTDVLIGYGNQFVIYDLEEKKQKNVLTLQGYFSEFTHTQDAIYLATDSNIICLDWAGRIRWVSPELGIDGVRIASVGNGVLKGEGEWDPPGGWKSFRLDQRTGQEVDK